MLQEVSFRSDQECPPLPVVLQEVSFRIDIQCPPLPVVLQEVSFRIDETLLAVQVVVVAMVPLCDAHQFAVEALSRPIGCKRIEVQRYRPAEAGGQVGHDKGVHHQDNVKRLS